MRVPSQRIEYLDALRAVAVVLVLGAHKYAFALWKNSGWMGVDLFFVLSGFLVSGLVFSEFIKYRKIDVGRFLLRRAFKIYPAFVCMMAVTLLIEIYRGSRISPLNWLAEFLFIQNYYPSIYGHTWSLAVEVHFYILLSVFLWWAVRHAPFAIDPFGSIPYAAVAVTLVSLGLRVATAAFLWGVSFDVRDYMCPTHLRLDSLTTGVVISYWYQFHNARFLDFARRRRIAIASAGCLLLVPPVVLGIENAFVVTAGFTCLSLGFGCILVVCLGLPSGKPAGTVPLCLATAGVGGVGVYSYGIYLWHMLVESLGISTLRKLVHGTPHYLIEFTAYALVSVLVGVVTSKLIEVPAIKIRDRFLPSRGKVGVPGLVAPTSSIVGERVQDPYSTGDHQFEVISA